MDQWLVEGSLAWWYAQCDNTGPALCLKYEFMDVIEAFLELINAAENIHCRVSAGCRMAVAALYLALYII